MGFKPKKAVEEEFEDEEDEEEEEDEIEVPTPQPAQPNATTPNWSVTTLPTEYQPVIWNAKKNKPYSVMEALVELLNKK